MAPGECVGLIGPNGAGKSTLLLHLNGILPDTLPSKSDPGAPGRNPKSEIPPAPAVVIDGTPIDRANLAVVRRRVGLLFQDADDQIFCPTVFEDVAFGPRQFGLPRDQVEQIVREALMTVGLAGFEKRAPHRLSGGEKRRVCLAGVLACRPSVLVLDEPSSGLDPRGRRELKALLQTIPATKIIATHDLELVVELCARTILLDHGAVVAEGPTATLLGNEELMLAHGLERPHILLHQHPHPFMSVPPVKLPGPG